MATHTSLRSLFTAIANAIRAKTGGNADIVADDFPTAIAAISTGITPSGTKQISITSNGTTTEDVTNYASAEITVAVSGGGGGNAYRNSGHETMSEALSNNAAYAIAHGLSQAPKYFCIWVNDTDYSSRKYLLNAYMESAPIKTLGTGNTSIETIFAPLMFASSGKPAMAFAGKQSGAPSNVGKEPDATYIYLVNAYEANALPVGTTIYWEAITW